MKTWKRTPRDAKRFQRELEPGREYWVILDASQAVAPYEDGKLASAYRFTEQQPITGAWMHGSMSAQALVLNYGPVFDSKPSGVRDIAGPGPQVAGPLPAGEEHGRRLDADELDHLDKYNRENHAASPNRRRKLHF